MLSMTPLWKEDGIGSCGTMIWFVFVTTPLAVVMLISGGAYAFFCRRQEAQWDAENNLLPKKEKEEQSVVTEEALDNDDV